MFVMVQLQSIHLRGFIGIKRGMNLDELSLDLSSLSGLVALDGPNGRGKTTVLDCFSPYRSLASRAGALKHHVFLRDSHKELTFSLGGHEYRTLIKVDAHNGKSEGYIWRDGVSEITGKIPEYDAYINELIGSKELFFNSVFAAQNAAKLNDLTPAELKKLFSEFLRLDRLIRHEETAKRCIQVLNGRRDRLDRDIEALDKQLDTLGDGEETLIHAQADMKDVNDRLTANEAVRISSCHQ